MLKIQSLWVKVVLAASLFVFHFALSGLSYASHPLITDDTGTQGKGKFQLEVNGGYGHNRDDGVLTQTVQAATTLTYGISDPVDLALTLPYEYIRVREADSVTKSNGISDLSLEAKWRFYEREGLSFAVKPGVSFPTGDEDKGLGSGKVDYHIFLIASKELKPWELHFNVGYTRNENKIDEKRNLWQASLAATVEVVKGLKIVGDVGIGSDTNRNLNIPNAFILGGLIYSVSENFDIDLGVKGGLTKPAEDYVLLTGITWKF